MLRSRRFAFAAAALLIGLSACGDDSSQRTVAGNTPAVIQLGSGSSTGGGAEAASMDKMMMQMQDITFVFDGDGSAVGSTGSAWTMPSGGSPDAARIEKLATLLGVEGELREVPADQGGGWMIGAADYSTATLMVSTDGMLSWWFNPAPSTAVSSVECFSVDPAVEVEPLDTDAPATTGDVVESTVGGDTAVVPPEGYCEGPPPPANVPDEAASLAKAKQLFADMGYDNSSYDYEVYADEWGANVTAYLLLNGMRSPLSLSVGFGAEGAITWASGSLATPVSAGDYPLVGVEGGVVRLNDESGQWGGYWGGPMAMARMETTSGSAEVAADSAGSAVGSGSVAVSESSTEPVSIDSPVCDPAADCVDEMPVLEPVTVTLTGVKMGLTMIWAADNTIWLLPAYEFSADDGGMYTVIAVDDSFIQLPAPYPTETIPVDTITVETTPVETAPVESVPTDTVLVADNQAVAEEVGKSIVGLPIDEATTVAEAAGFTVRVLLLDGVDQVATADLRTDRLNVSVVDGIVTGIISIG